MTLGGSLLLAGNSVQAGSTNLEDNDGSTLTTKQGDPIQESQLYGKWDLDGKRTNTANGKEGVGAIPSDIVKDIMGAGWEFRPQGVLKIDKTIGHKTGAWRLDGHTLYIKLSSGAEETAYDAHFEQGFLYLKAPSGHWMVMERDKFFGF